MTIGATSATVLAAAGISGRTEAFITNDHATNVLYLSLGGTAVANTGIRLDPGETLVLGSYDGQINGIATGAGTVVCIAEV